MFITVTVHVARPALSTRTSSGPRGAPADRDAPLHVLLDPATARPAGTWIGDAKAVRWPGLRTRRWAYAAVAPDARRAVLAPLDRSALILVRARNHLEANERAEAARHVRLLLDRSGLGEQEFASRIGVLPDDLTGYLDAAVSPPASLMIRMRRLSDRFARMRAQRETPTED